LPRRRPGAGDWKSGDRLWVVEVVAPFGPAGGGQASLAEEMVKDLKANVFPSREVKFLALGRNGKREVRIM
jgi:hemolysin-activating ACP:hemolysin acyltransferase